MTVLLVWTLDVDRTRRDEALTLAAERRQQVERLGAQSLRIFDAQHADQPAERWIALEEFESDAALEAFITAQNADPDAQATIANTFAPIGPITVVHSDRISELALY
jgi:hypothetical protein